MSRVLPSLSTPTNLVASVILYTFSASPSLTVTSFVSLSNFSRVTSTAAASPVISNKAHAASNIFRMAWHLTGGTHVLDARRRGGSSRGITFPRFTWHRWQVMIEGYDFAFDRGDSCWLRRAPGVRGTGFPRPS